MISTRNSKGSGKLNVCEMVGELKGVKKKKWFIILNLMVFQGYLLV